MNVTEVRIQLVSKKRDKLCGFASITIDDSIVIRDIKVIDGPRGYFVAMPSRKLTHHCSSCGSKNALRARYCNECGARQAVQGGEGESKRRVRLYADIAHPIHQEAREYVSNAVLDEFRRELARSKRAGYVARRFEDLDYEEPAAPPGYGNGTYG